MYLNVIKSYRDVVAVCDKELLGKIFEEQVEDVTRQLDVKENFYKGSSDKTSTEEEVIQTLQKMAEEDATFNIVGEKSIGAAIEAGIITEESVGKIKGIPFALILL